MAQKVKRPVTSTGMAKLLTTDPSHLRQDEVYTSPDSSDRRAGASAARKSILVVCPFPEGLAPAQRLKYEQYIGHWSKNGYDVTLSSFMDEELYGFVWSKGNLLRKVFGTLKGYLRRLGDAARIASFDAVYVFMWVTPLGPPLSEKLLRRLAKVLIYDIDDNVHLGQDLPTPYDPNPLVRLLKGKSKPIYLMQEADYVVTSSPFLEAEARKLNRAGRCVYITSSVDTDYFVPGPSAESKQKTIIGWTGTFSSRPFLDMMAPALRKLAQKRPFEFRVIGNFDYEMDGVDLKVVQFDKAREVEDLRALDIGVYPLPNNPWVLGKSGLKAIVYMAMGLPVVASRVGTTPLLYEHGEIGFMVDTDDDWVDALVKLIDDPALREAMGAKAREVAVANYSRQAVCRSYLSVLDESVGAKA